MFPSAPQLGMLTRFCFPGNPPAFFPNCNTVSKVPMRGPWLIANNKWRSWWMKVADQILLQPPWWLRALYTYIYIYIIIILYYIILYSNILYYSIVYYIILCHIISYHIISYYNRSYYIISYYIILDHIVSYCIIP